jgi:TctA family transporter
MVISGAAGRVLRKFGYEMAPLLLALVLGDRLESGWRSPCQGETTRPSPTAHR